MIPSFWMMENYSLFTLTFRINLKDEREKKGVYLGISQTAIQPPHFKESSTICPNMTLPQINLDFYAHIKRGWVILPSH